MHKSVYLVAASLLLSLSLNGQSSPSGEGRGVVLWVGASVSLFNPDYGCTSSSPFTCGSQQLIGLGPYADTGPLFFKRIGAEAEANFLRWHGPTDLTEHSYLGGPRMRLLTFHKLSFNGKFVLGVGQLSVPAPSLGSGTYFAYAPGGDVSFRITKRVAVRGGYEYQIWPNFTGAFVGPGHEGGLSPNGFHAGVSYAVW